MIIKFITASFRRRLFALSISILNFNFMKYKIMFSENGPMVCIAKDLTDIQAVQFAINLHQSSNVKHSIFVFEVEKVESPLLVLQLK